MFDGDRKEIIFIPAKSNDTSFTRILPSSGVVLLIDWCMRKTLYRFVPTVTYPNFVLSWSCDSD